MVLRTILLLLISNNISPDSRTSLPWPVDARVRRSRVAGQRGGSGARGRDGRVDADARIDATSARASVAGGWWMVDGGGEAVVVVMVVMVVH